MLKREIYEKTNFKDGIMIGDRTIRDVEYYKVIRFCGIKVYEYSYVSDDIINEEAMKPSGNVGFKSK